MREGDICGGYDNSSRDIFSRYSTIKLVAGATRTIPSRRFLKVSRVGCMCRLEIWVNELLRLVEGTDGEDRERK